MNAEKLRTLSIGRIAGASLVAVSMLWLAQPPFCLWLLGFVALVPFIDLIEADQPIRRRGYLAIWAISSLYFLLSLQGLRLAHPAMVFPWLALGGYLGVYLVVFVGVARKLRSSGVPLLIVVPLVWIAQECVRNYLLTGISAIMLGHVFADVPTMIQIADLFGSYGPGAVAALCSVAVWDLKEVVRRSQSFSKAGMSSVAAVVALSATIGYGTYRLSQPEGDPLATFALIQRNEPVEYGQSIEREVEMFQAYARQSIEVARAAETPIDAFVWPESMYTGGSPWMFSGNSMVVPEAAGMTDAEFQQWVQQQQRNFQERSGYVQNALAAELPDQRRPQLIVGCGVVSYDDVPHVYSGVIRIEGEDTAPDWYGKTHLVMFGEYIPIAPYIPGIRSLIPPGMGLQKGPGAICLSVGDTVVSPNICIETAVERVTVRQMQTLDSNGGMPDVIVTVTNDGWFDDSSVIDHHLRCAQLVAVACRRPLLSAANNGPTAWIDSRGRIIERVATGSEGAILATPLRDSQRSLAVRIGDWPARITVLLCLLLLLRTRFSNGAETPDESESSDPEAVVTDS
ncbi:MAG: apolipoprotein N-acyltransferase [Rubripirellula sp.]